MNDPKPQQLEDISLAENQEERTPCIILADCSSSMQGAPIDELNRCFPLLKQSLINDEMAAAKVELAVCPFGKTVQLVQNFCSPYDFEPPVLKADGYTPMAGAISLGLETINNRKIQYEEAGVSYTRPWLFLITDGEATDDIDSVIPALHKAHQNESILFFAIGIKGANMTRLAEISPPGRAVKALDGLKFEELFEWLSNSLSLRVATPGSEQVAAAQMDNWEAI